jgi:hypothetical protein
MSALTSTSRIANVAGRAAAQRPRPAVACNALPEEQSRRAALMGIGLALFPAMVASPAKALIPVRHTGGGGAA